MTNNSQNKQEQKNNFEQLNKLPNLIIEINKSLKDFRKMKDAFEALYRNIRQKRHISMQEQNISEQSVSQNQGTDNNSNIISKTQTAETAESISNSNLSESKPRSDNPNNSQRPSYQRQVNQNSNYQGNNYRKNTEQRPYEQRPYQNSGYQGNNNGYQRQPYQGQNNNYQNNYQRPNYQGQQTTTNGGFNNNYRNNNQQGGYNRPAGQNNYQSRYNNVAYNNRVTKPTGTAFGQNTNTGFKRKTDAEPLPDFIRNYGPQRAPENKKKYDSKFEEKRTLNKRQQMKFGLLSEVDSEERMGSRKLKFKKQKEEHIIVPVSITHAVITTDTFTVKDLSEKISKPAGELIKKFMDLGMMLTINSQIGFEEAELVAAEFGITLEHKVGQTAEEKLHENQISVQEDDENVVKRPPVITVMGHVDHGKTSLLDAIRKTNVISGEAGGITQHIGAYTVSYNKQPITFIDTPGHAAFTAMRARGAKVTDIAILVVAADDGVMPQTVEAIKHIKEAKVPMIVAINKIDKPEANIDRIKQQLTEYEVVPEEWGGDAYVALISAKTGEGLDKLMELILLVSEMQDLKANPLREANGSVLEANLDKTRGVIATLLILNGTLHVGDTVVCGTSYGKIKSIINDKGQTIKDAGPSMPVSIMGLNEVPSAGDYFYVTNDTLSKQVIAERKNKIKLDRITKASVSLDDFLARVDESKLKSIKLIIKSDVQGSSEALAQTLKDLSNDEVKVSVIYAQAGQVNESDINLAKASNAQIIAFNIKVNGKTALFAQRNKVDIKQYKIIYEAVDDITAQIKGLKEPVYEVVELGKALVVMVFKLSSQGTVAGARVTNGKIYRNSKARVLRNDEKLADNLNIDSLKIQKEDQKEVAENFECGIKLAGYNDFKENDVIECYRLEQIKD